MMQSPGLHAATLGSATVLSVIGQPLNAEIELSALSNAEFDSLTVRPAPAETYAEANLDYSAVLRSLRFTVEKKAERHIIRVTSDQAVTEPFLTILFEFTASGNRMMRQYALLLDPPAIDQAPAAATAVPASPLLSDAAPEPAANRDSAVPAPAAAAGVDGQSVRRVQRGDTLARIAEQVRPEGVQLAQVLVAIQRANPDGFDGRNMNRVRAGSVLQVPAADTIKAVDINEARRLVRAQTADFARYRSRIAQLATNQANAPQLQPGNDGASNNRSASGSIGVRAPEPGAGVAAQDKLQLSAPGATSSNASDSVAAAASLDKIAAERALAEANSRVQALEKSLADMQQLLELKNQTLADMQARQAAAPTSPAPVAQAAAKVESEKKQTTQQAPDPQPASRPLGAVIDWLREPWVLPAGGAVAVLLLAFALLRERRRKRSRSANKFAQSQSDPTTSPDVFSERDSGNGNSVFHSNFVPSASQLDTNEVDPIAEADVYIAYGRDEQAEEILKDALKNHPERNALRVKLLELYAGRKDAQAFGKLAADLHRLTDGANPDWLRVAQMGQLLDPGNLLYGAMRSADVPPAARTDADLKRKQPTAAPAEAEADSAMLDFDIKLDNMLLANTKNEAPVANAKPKNSDLLPGEEGRPPVTSTTDAKRGSAPADFNLAGISLDLLPDSAPPVANASGLADLTTKLDLALACREIGDKDGARELLDEVAAGSDAGLASKARSLLQQLA